MVPGFASLKRIERRFQPVAQHLHPFMMNGCHLSSTARSTVMSASLSSRLRLALKAAAWHAALSLAVAALVAVLVFGLWFPGPLRELAGGAELFWLIVGVDVVCGPLLTLVVFNPAKPRRELFRDLAWVALIQIAALAYGVHTLSYARPVALVFEVDRFRVVGHGDLDGADLAQLPDWAQPWRFSRARTLGTRAAASGEEQLASVQASLQGIEPSQRPSWWQEYALSTPAVLQRARPLSDLRGKHPAQGAVIDHAAMAAMRGARTGESTDPAALRWLPIVSRRAMDWVVLIDPNTARLRGFVHLDGF